ncbi:hypothetical protein CLV34_0070 [Luteimicrobium subarcticum]|uniref:DUF7660 domain-containing protein n=2 Tax=Luteimicrobium subarcticum TaxID=620910 RepID=A0A2M8WW99_9MICO|nr:hypothetical protein CLV34_0070 [Luteimicrobium subarcticum]
MNRSDFADFIDRLADSFSADPDEWENANLLDFLRAWAAWLEDMDGYFSGRHEPVPSQPTWQLIADMLLAARVYE